MNFRPPTMKDHRWMLDAYAKWGDEPYTLDDIKRWIKRWMARSDEVCLVAEVEEMPVGLITYRTSFFVAKVDNILVRPAYQKRGYARQMWQMLKERLVPEGIMVAEFKTLPGPIRQQLGTRFENIDGVHGRVTWDMEV